ncbi:MAG: GPW/gp25 family protein [Clostridia bacterium]|nr:GPW/gp25 family protein [Clostridia bacterium]
MSVIKGWKFPVQIDKKTGRIMTVEDNENIKQSVRIILGTQKYERKIYPGFGTDLRSFMFEIIDPTLISTLKSSIKSSLDTWEEHIESLNIGVIASAGTVSKLEVSIDYITDIEPTQERVVERLDNNDI